MTGWREMDDAARMDLEPGAVGWKYRSGTPLPKGQFFEELREPITYPSGAVHLKTRWASNGVDLPSMQLIGTPGTKTQPHKDSEGWYPLPPTAYRPFRPASPGRNARPKASAKKAAKDAEK